MIITLMMIYGLCFIIVVVIAVVISNVLYYFQRALHLRATGTFKDVYGVTRKNGEEWLVTMSEAESHIPDVHEEVTIIIKTLFNKGGRLVDLKYVVKIEQGKMNPKFQMNVRNSSSAVIFLY